MHSWSSEYVEVFMFIMLGLYKALISSGVRKYYNESRRSVATRSALYWGATLIIYFPL